MDQIPADDLGAPLDLTEDRRTEMFMSASTG